MTGRELAEAAVRLDPRTRATLDRERALLSGQEDDASAIRRFVVLFTRRVLDEFAVDSGSPLFRDWMLVLEGALGRDPEVDILVEVAVSGPLCEPPDQGPDPLPLLGPGLRSIVEAERNWREGPRLMRLAETLLTAVPALQPLAEAQRYGSAGDVLVYNFLGDVATREARLVAEGNDDEAKRVCALLEQAHGGSTTSTGQEDDVDEAIGVSFVEGLPLADEPGAAVIDMLGPKLRRALTLQRPSLYALGPDGVVLHLSHSLGSGTPNDVPHDPPIDTT